MKRALILASGTTFALGCGFFLGRKMFLKDDDGGKRKKLLDTHHPESGIARIQVYDSLASTFEQKVGRTENLIGVTKVRENFIRNHAKGRVLDVACGVGNNLDFVDPSQIKEMVMVDLSQNMLEQTKHRIEKHPQKNLFLTQLADAQDLSCFPDDSFDTVIDCFGLCSIENPSLAIKEMLRVLKPDTGRLVLLEHGRSQGTTLFHRVMNKYMDSRSLQHVIDWGCSWNRDIVQICRNESNCVIENIHMHNFQTCFEIICQKKK